MARKAKGGGSVDGVSTKKGGGANQSLLTAVLFGNIAVLPADKFQFHCNGIEAWITEPFLG